MPDNQIIFGAEFNNEGLNKGVDDTIKKLVELQDTQSAIKEEVDGYNEVLKRSQETIQKNNDQMAKLKKTNDDLAKSYKDVRQEAVNYGKEGNSAKYDELRGKLKGIKDQIQQNSDAYLNLRKQNVATEGSIKTLTSNIDKHRESLIQVQHQLHEVKKATSEAESINLEARRSFERLTSVQYLAGEGMNHMRRELVTLGTEFITGFVGGMAATVIPMLIEFIEKLGEAEGSLKNFANAANIEAIFKGARSKTGEDLIRLEAIRLKLNDTSIAVSERTRLANEYNKKADEGNKIDITQISNLDGLNKKIEDQISLIKQRALTQAAINKIDEEANKLISNEVKLQEELSKRGFQSLNDYQDKQKKVLADQVKAFQNTPAKDFLKNSADGLTNVKKGLDGVANPSRMAAENFDLSNRAFQGLIDQVKKGRGELDSLVKQLSGFITIEGLTTDKKPKKEIENVFKEKLAELKAKLAAVATSEFQSDTLIEDKFKEQLNKEYEGIAKLLHEGKLTQGQANILDGLLKQINSVEISKALDDFHKKQKDAVKMVSDAILEAQVEDGRARANNLRNEFQKGQEIIEQDYEKTVNQLGKKLSDLIEKIDEDVKKGLLSKDQGAAKKTLLTSIFGDLIDQAGVARINAQLELSFKAFQRTIENLKLTLEHDTVDLSEATTAQVQKLATEFLQGSITYERYQRQLTKTLQEEANKRRKIQIQELEDELRSVNAKMAANTDQTIGRQLDQQQAKIREQLSSLRREDATQGAEQDEAETKRKFDNILKYVNAVKQVTDAILSFWAQVTAAEQAQIDRSIALQQRRVDNAQLIAERGNATYLKQEQKRMDELVLKQQDNARKQLAINNALTMSQATVAAITAIAQAVETGDPFAGIAAVAAVIGAIAAAYSFVNALQPVEASFFEGTEFVDDIGRPVGKDTVPARLHKGERVITADDNQRYWDTLHALHNHSVPPDVLNDFVNNYPHGGASVDFSRLALATNTGIGNEAAMLQHLSKLNDTMGKVVEGVSALGVNVNLDEYGFSLSLMQTQKKLSLRNRS